MIKKLSKSLCVFLAALLVMLCGAYASFAEGAGAWECMSVTYTDGDGEVVEDWSEGMTEIYAEAMIRHSYSSAQTAWVVIACYNANGAEKQLLAANQRKVTVAARTMETVSVSLDLSDITVSDATIVKLFVWDEASSQPQESYRAFPSAKLRTNTCEDFNLSVPVDGTIAPEAGKWSYAISVPTEGGNDLTDLRWLRRGGVEGFPFSENEYTFEPRNPNHVYCMENTGFMINDGQWGFLWNYTVDEKMAASPYGLKVSGTIGSSNVAGVSITARVLLTHDTDTSVPTGDYDVLYEGVSSDEGQSIRVELPEGAVQVGNDIIIAIQRSDGTQWWTGFYTNFSIESNNPVRRTNSLEDFNRDHGPDVVSQPEAGKWSYFYYDLGYNETSFDQTKYMFRGSNGIFSSEEYTACNADPANRHIFCFCSDGHMVSDGCVYFCEAFTIDKNFASAPNGLTVSGFNRQTVPGGSIEYKVIRTKDTNVGKISGEFDVLCSGTTDGEEGFSVHLPAGSVQEGNDIIFITRNMPNGQWWTAFYTEYDIEFTSYVAASNSRANFTLSVAPDKPSTPIPGKWSYIHYYTDANTEVFDNYVPLKRGGTEGSLFGDKEYVGSNTNSVHCTCIENNGTIITDGQVKMAEVFTVDDAYAAAANGLTVKGRLTNCSAEATVTLRVLKTNDTEASVLSGAYTVLYEKEIATSDTFSVNVPSAEAGNDIVFEVTRSNDSQWYMGIDTDFTVECTPAG